MRARRGDAHAVLAGEADDLGPHLADVLADLGDVLADARADLDDRLVHLGLDPLLQDELALVEDLLDVGAQLPRLGIEDLELLLDAEGEGRRGPSRTLRRLAAAACPGPPTAPAATAGFFGRAVRLLRRSERLAAGEERLPAIVGEGLRRLLDPLEEPLCRGLDDPLEVLLADGLDGGVGRGVQEVDGVGNAVAHRELERAEVVAQRVHELEAVAADALLQRRIERTQRP